MSEAKIYYQEDCNLSVLEGKTIAIIGYGSPGHAHALNLKESGCNVIVGLYEGSKSKAKAEAQGLTVYNTAEAAKLADIIMILINDEKQAAMYKKDIEPNLKAGDMLMFAHGFNIHLVSTRQARELLPSLLYIRMLPARHSTRLLLMAQASALPAQVSWRPHSEPRPKPICSVSRLSFAAAFAH